MTAPLQVVVMGVSATGKSSVATGLCEALGWTFVEGDDLHPESNVAKMAAGEPLTDADRAPWLDRVNARMREQAAAGSSTVLTCSALKHRYRDRLRDRVPAVFFLHLHAPFEVLEPRMTGREKHFMPTSLLTSQFETLESLTEDEDGQLLDVSPDLDTVIEHAVGVVRRRAART